MQNDSFGFLPGWPIVPYSNLPLPQLENQEQKCTSGLGSHGGKSMGFQVRSLDTETLPQLPPIYGLKICILVSSSREKNGKKCTHFIRHSDNVTKGLW